MKQLQKNADSGEGWSVQVYSGDRRLICSLYPSHIWMFLVGLFLGIVFTSIISTEQSAPAATEPASPAPMEAPLMLE
jgi:hypothetical protein